MTTAQPTGHSVPDPSSAGPAIDAAVRLTDVLRRENAALAEFDLTRAGALLPEKEAAAEDFARALASHPACVKDGSDAESIAAELRAETDRNRALLKRALDAQTRVMDVIATAIRRSVAMPGYGACGMVTAGRASAMTVSRRA